MSGLTTVMLISFLVMVLIGVPITFATGSAVMLYLVMGGDIPGTLLAQRMYNSSASFTMLAVPLFIIAGELMNKAGITKRIVRLSTALMGHIRGSLAHVTILASMLFAGLSGSSVAAASSVGGMLIPAMKEDGYDAGFGAAVTACSACMGPIIPPSIAFIIYSSITGDSVGKLFLGGIIPGIIMGISLMVIAYVISKKRNYPVRERSSTSEKVAAVKGSALAILMPVIIVGGIMTGIFTSTEAGAIGLLYGLLVGLLTKELPLKEIPSILINGALTSASIMYIIATSQALGWILTIERLPQALVAFLSSLTSNSTAIIFIILGTLLIMGCFLVDTAMITIMTPLFIPIVKQYGIDPIQFGVVMVMMTTVGGITPPVGNLLFVASGIAETPVLRTAKAMVPFAGALLISMALCALIPPLVTFLPNLLG
ncbi:MAG: TRAP transporter large permease [Lawsonibacter sp.]|jgi:tripartite ATP-independent transporter DctM subunit